MRIRHEIPLDVLVGLLLILGGASAYGQPFSELIVFGDSLSDTGNVLDLTFFVPLSPPNLDGRFSNGHVWIEQLSSQLELTRPRPSRLGGTNYAHGAAQTGSGKTNLALFLNVPNIGKQVNNFLKNHTPVKDQLFVIWGAGNDLLNGQKFPEVPVGNISSHITKLASAGAQSFLVPNLPPLGQIPAERGGSNQVVLDNRTNTFNSLLTNELDDLETTLGITIFQLDVFNFFAQVSANPSLFGFRNVSDPALTGVTAVSNPEEFLFWDDIHPTASGHRFIGDQAASLLNPELTHHWNSSDPSPSWATATHWNPTGQPAASWHTQLDNNSTSNTQRVQVQADSIIRSAEILGTAGPLVVAVEQATSLAIQESMIVHDGGQIEVLTDGLLSSRTLEIGNESSKGHAAVFVNPAGSVQVTESVNILSSGTMVIDGNLSAAQIHSEGGTLAGSGKIEAPVYNSGTMLIGEYLTAVGLNDHHGQFVSQATVPEPHTWFLWATGILVLWHPRHSGPRLPAKSLTLN